MWDAYSPEDLETLKLKNREKGELSDEQKARSDAWNNTVFPPYVGEGDGLPGAIAGVGDRADGKHENVFNEGQQAEAGPAKKHALDMIRRGDKADAERLGATASADGGTEGLIQQALVPERGNVDSAVDEKTVVQIKQDAPLRLEKMQDITADLAVKNAAANAATKKAAVDNLVGSTNAASSIDIAERLINDTRTLAEKVEDVHSRTQGDYSLEEQGVAGTIEEVEKTIKENEATITAIKEGAAESQEQEDKLKDEQARLENESPDDTDEVNIPTTDKVIEGVFNAAPKTETARNAEILAFNGTIDASTVNSLFQQSNKEKLAGSTASNREEAANETDELKAA